MSSAWARTPPSRVPSPDSVVGPGPDVAGWLPQVTPSSLQSDAMRTASSVRPSVADEAYTRSVAAISLQPGGTGGRSKWTSARSVPPLGEPTFRIESLPKFVPDAAWDTQLSKSAGTGRSVWPAQRCSPPPPSGVSSDSYAPASKP